MQVLTVSAVVSFLREVIESSGLFSDLWIAGEVSNYSRSGLGHRYFSLRDPQGVLRTVLFRDDMPGLALKDGDRVLAHGYVSIYPQRGELQFVCNFVKPEGVGILAAQLEELRARLEREGLFDPARKRPLPRYPLRIGLVTSPSGAALQDIRNVLARRWPVAELVLAPAAVQGADAPRALAVALRRLAAAPALDLIILARGGGASEDLSAFNAEQVARAIFSSPVPVVSGVGHETDETIADLVADLRAPTPSAAAERSTPSLAEVRRQLAASERAIAAAAVAALASAATALDSGNRRLERAAPDLAGLEREVAHCARILRAEAEHHRAACAGRLAGASARLEALDPRATLARGFAIIRPTGTKRVVSSVRHVHGGMRLDVAVTDGTFWAEVG